jgi:hypothetical protein
VVLDAFANDRAAVEICGALACDGREFWIAESNYFSDAAGSVVGDN